MTLRISFELDEDDLQHFRLIMRQARNAAARFTPEEIVANAERQLDSAGSSKVPQFIRERLDKLTIMIRMLLDHEWRLPNRESVRVLNALAYFGEPEDLIPDHIPGLGFLDDAIIIELVTRELRHEIDAYRDFCEFRRKSAPKTGVKSKSSDMNRDKWLESRRKELQDRMRRRRKRGTEDTDGKPPLRLL